jgi:hypothetical protein
MVQGTMLYHTLDRSRWFIVPIELELAEGELSVRSFTRAERQVDPALLQPHEVDAAAAKQWIDHRFREAFGRPRARRGAPGGLAPPSRQSGSAQSTRASLSWSAPSPQRDSTQIGSSAQPGSQQPSR